MFFLYHPQASISLIIHNKRQAVSGIEYIEYDDEKKKTTSTIEFPSASDFSSGQIYYLFYRITVSLYNRTIINSAITISELTG